MPINRDSLNKRLYKALGRYDAKPVDDKNEVIPLEDEADAFRFNFTKSGENYGQVYVTLDDTNSLTLWYDDEIMGSPDSPTKGMDYDDTFTGFMKYLKNWAMNNQLKFNTDNKDHLGNEMARRKRMKEKENISEGYYALGKKASYSDAVPSVKIVLQHSKVMQEGEQRFRHIEKIFVENQQGERFLVPTTKPGLARVFARHIAEGGTPYDERAGHIQSLVEEYQKMAGFVRATRNGQFNESAQSLVQEGINHYVKLRESLSKMTGRRGYTAYFENWTPTLMEDETDATAINELFVQETLDPRIESVMPILSRLHKQVSEMKEVTELDEWAESLLAEKMVMGADSDASASGTVFNEESLDDLDEATDLATIPEQGLDELGEAEEVDESGLQAYLGNKKYGREGMDALRKAGREHAGKEKMAKIRAKYDKLDEVEMEEGLGNIVKKAGGALKTVAKKALDVISPDDEQQLIDLRMRAGLNNPEHGKPNMAKPNNEGVAEDLDADQKRVGQLGPTEKVKNNNIGKLVGANESVEQLGELKKSTVKSYADKKQAELDDVPPMPFKKPGMSKHEHEKAAKGMTGALARLSGKKPTSEGSLNEMDSEGYKGIRDDYEIGKGKEGKAKPVKPGEVAKKGADALNKAMDKEHKKEVKEGQEDLDAILRIIRK